MLKICAISDTHNRHNKLVIPECDILIHAGDATSQGYKYEIEDFAKWMHKQEAGYIIWVPGNHELQFEKDLPESMAWFKDHCPDAHVLIDQTIEIEGIKIHGSPVQPWFCDWAWNRASGKEGYHDVGYGKRGKTIYPPPIKPHWDMIPDDTNILITHGPPYGILDKSTYANGEPRHENLGCELLMNRIKELKDLDLHFFGHIHSPGGQQVHLDGVSFYNCAICDECYYPSNPITEVDYER